VPRGLLRVIESVMVIDPVWLLLTKKIALPPSFAMLFSIQGCLVTLSRISLPSL